MKFIHLIEAGQKDGAGQLMVEAEGSKEVKQLFNCFYWHNEEDNIIIAKGRAVESGSYLYTSEQKSRFWFATSGILPKEISVAYLDSIKQLYGLSEDAQLPSEMDLTPFIPNRLIITHIIESLKLESDGTIHYKGFQKAEEWNKMSAKENADRYSLKYITEDIAVNERYGHYGTKYKLSSAWLYNALVNNHFYHNHFTDGQRNIFDLSAKYRTAFDVRFNDNHSCEAKESHKDLRFDSSIFLYVNEKTYKHITWEQFRNA